MVAASNIGCFAHSQDVKMESWTIKKTCEFVGESGKIVDTNRKKVFNCNMNYINQLQLDNAKLATAIRAAQSEINSFRIFLVSSKFTGTERDGSRKDWISTGDVERRLRENQTVLNDSEIY